MCWYLYANNNRVTDDVSTHDKTEYSSHAHAEVVNEKHKNVWYWNYIRRLYMWPPPTYVRRNHDLCSTVYNTVIPINVALIGMIYRTHESRQSIIPTKVG